jgi:hypothetical protein
MKKWFGIILRVSIAFIMIVLFSSCNKHENNPKNLFETWGGIDAENVGSVPRETPTGSTAAGTETSPGTAPAGTTAASTEPSPIHGENSGTNINNSNVNEKNPEETGEQIFKKVYVKDQQELRKAIASHTYIVIDTDELEIDGSITIDNIKNLKIESFNELPYHLIFSGPDNEIKITNSENIRFTNLRIGHAEQDNGCPSGIFNIADSTNLIITNCILYGCGGNGLVARNSSYVQVSDTDIIGCVKEAVKLHSVRNSSFKNCRFLYNGAKAFSLFKCDMVRFDGLYAKGNGKYINESTSDYLFEFTACKDILLANAVMKENMVKQI